MNTFSNIKPVILALVVLLALVSIASTPPAAAQFEPAAASSNSTVPDPASVSAALQSAPVMFIENAGQFADGARFQVRGGNGTIWLAQDALWVTALERPTTDDERRKPPTRDTPPSSVVRPSSPRRGVHLKLSFPGANPHPRLEPFDRLDTHVSYFIGSDPAKWRTDVPVWGGVRYKDYPQHPM